MKFKKFPLLAVPIIAGTLLLSSCLDSAVAGDQVLTNQILTQLDQVEPVPVFNWSLRRSEMIQLYAAQNRDVTTYSYAMSATGKVEASCASLGWPIPGGTQLTNPQQVSYASATGGGVGTISQAEPDGLYPPSTSQGTYVMCVNPDGTVSPLYAEPEILTFTQPMQANAQGVLEPVPGHTPSVKINPAPPASVPTPAGK